MQASSAPIEIRARVTPPKGDPVTGSARVDTSAAQPLLFRRGPTTANRVQPAADFRFSRTERLRLELPLSADGTPGAGRLLDRNGQTLPIPVQVGVKEGSPGERWLTADATLSALAAGDYVVVVAYTTGGTEQQVMTAIRVTR